jgi:hypothetical protein
MVPESAWQADAEPVPEAAHTESEPETISFAETEPVSEAGLEAAPEIELEAEPAVEPQMSADATMPDAEAFERGGGRVEDNEGWPEGSQRIAVGDQTPMPVIAPNDHRPVERPVMDPNVIGAGALDDNLGDAAPAAGPREPAAE